MNDNLILGRIVAKGTGRLLCVLIGMLLFLSCGSDNAEVDVEITFNPSEVFTEYRTNSAEYITALKLSSTDIQVRDRQSDIILSISFDYPTVKFTTTVQKVSVNKDLVSVEVNTTLDYRIGGEQVDNPWDFRCEFSVPADSEELVAEYNNIYKSNCQLLPINNYDLGKGMLDKSLEGNGPMTVDYLSKTACLPILI